MDKDKDLLPCPFCGGEDIDEYEGDYGNGVYCMNCGVMMGEQIHKEFHVHERVTYEQAAEAWNTRTPEQAIAATLGGGKLTAEQVMMIAGKHQPDYCSDTHVCFDWQAIADELNATPGGGECELVYGENDHGDDGWWCQSCGEWFAVSFRHTGLNNIIVPSYCQHCGKAVKR